MQLDKPLTKENFWNEMMTTFPKSMKIFCAWIDEYKEAVFWKGLFGQHETKGRGITICSSVAPKFHDIPYEMQQGIWICFVNDTLHKFFEQPEYDYQFDLAEDIKQVFGELEPLIDEDH